MTNQDQRNDPDSGHASLNWSFSLGKKPPELPDTNAAEGASSSESRASFELADGKLRFGSADRPLFEVDLNPAQEPLEDPFPVLTTIRTWLHRLVTLIAVALPILFVGTCLATGQAADVTFFAGVFGLILSAMLMSSFSPKRTVLSAVLEDVLTDMARRQIESTQQPTPAVEPAMQPPEPAAPEAPKVFTIICENCGASFPPVPPTAICPECSTPALPG